MPGEFSKASRPSRPGAYVNFQAEVPRRITPNPGSVVCIPMTHDWGPAGQPTLTVSYSDFLAQFGDTANAGRLAVELAFRGEDLPARGGAGGVLVYRFTGTGQAIASLDIQNTTPAAALTVDAKYPGTYGNRIEVSDNPSAATGTHDFEVYLDGVRVERWTYPTIDLADLADQVNAASRYVTLTVTADGVALGTAAATPQPLTGGANGTEAGSDWDDAQSTLEFEQFGLLAPVNLTDDAILTPLALWATQRNTQGQRFMLVVGGGAADTVATANTRSQALNDANIVNTGGYTVDDASAGVLTSAQCAPRIAGILAQRGEAKAITFARLAGVTLLVRPSAADVDAAFGAGTVVLSQDSNANAPVRIEKGLTTFTQRNLPNKPYAVFRSPKFVRTMHGLENDLTSYAQSQGIIGELGVNDKTRMSVLGAMGALLSNRETAGILQPGSQTWIDQDPPPSDDDDFIALAYSVKFLRDVEQIFNTITVA